MFLPLFCPDFQDAMACRFDYLLAPLVKDNVQFKDPSALVQDRQFEAPAMYDSMMQLNGNITQSVSALRWGGLGIGCAAFKRGTISPA